MNVEHVGTSVSFDVYGIPAPQGSKTRMPNGAIIEGKTKGQRERHRAWRLAVADTAQRMVQLHGPMPPGPIVAIFTFRFPMTGSARKADRDRGWRPKTTRPDIDKIERSTLDGLKDGGLIADDALIFRVWKERIEVIGWTGAAITLDVAATRERREP